MIVWAGIDKDTSFYNHVLDKNQKNFIAEVWAMLFRIHFMKGKTWLQFKNWKILVFIELSGSGRFITHYKVSAWSSLSYDVVWRMSLYF